MIIMRVFMFSDWDSIWCWEDEDEDEKEVEVEEGGGGRGGVKSADL